MAGEIDRSDWHWQSPRWQDLRFPASGINPIGAGADPSIDIDLDGIPGSLLFSASQDNYMTVLVQLPHGFWRAGKLHPHIHYARVAAGSGSIKWQARHRFLGNVAGAFSAWTAWTDLVDAIPAQVPDVHLLSAYQLIDPVGVEDSAMFCFALRRLATDPADTYAGLARLLELDWHVQLIAAGSEAEMPS